MDFLYEGFAFFDNEETDGVAGDVDVSESVDVTLEPYLMRSSHYWQQVPLPPDMVLDGTNLLATLDDETLLTMSSTLIAHVQRTEASGGLQVISPRAVTLGGVAARTCEPRRTTDMFLVGSAGNRIVTWPTSDNYTLENYFWREPIDSYPNDPSTRPRTVTAGILSTTRLIDDPITKAFLIGRALVDLQRRPDVAGSADALSAVLAKCWDISPDDYDDMGEASLAPVGDLLRYAIRSDASYPMVNAPVQARKCISVGANTAGRLLYGEHAAIDWRRMRVLAESVFYQSSRLEGHTLLEMVAASPPGNPRAPPVRPGILQMRPLPGSVWSFDSHTFRLSVSQDVDTVPAVRVPDRVRASVARYHDSARPVAIAAAAGVEVSHARTMAINFKSDTAEAIVTGYRKLLQVNSAFSARGRTSSAAVRGFVYSCLAENTTLSAIRSLWLARYMHATTEALNYTSMLDVTTTRHVASRMSDLTTDMRARLGVEAGKRGSDLETWWKNLAALLPSKIAAMREGSATWALGAAHMMLHPPTDKWGKLVRAMGYASHESLARGHLKDVRLPARLGSPERTLAAAEAVARQLGTSYGAYYRAMYDVSCVLAARLKRAGNMHGAERIRLAGMMWDIRAAVASTVSVRIPDGSSTQAGVIIGKHSSYHFTVAPYDAYQRWRSALSKSAVVHRDIKSTYPHHANAVISRTFADKSKPVFKVSVGATSRMFRYVCSPSRLASDIERTLELMLRDVTQVILYYDGEADLTQEDWPMEAGQVIVPLALDMGRFKPPAGSYWDIIATMDQMTAADIVDAVTRMDDSQAADIEGREYDGPDELAFTVWGVVDEIASAGTRDAVF
jgi:hypothetical protein